MSFLPLFDWPQERMVGVDSDGAEEGLFEGLIDSDGVVDGVGQTNSGDGPKSVCDNLQSNDFERIEDQ